MNAGTNGQLTLLPLPSLSPKKNLKSPFKLFFEFTDPSNNLTLMRYFPGQNPFDLFDFSAAIPNPATREKAKADDLYKKRYNPYNNRK